MPAAPACSAPRILAIGPRACWPAPLAEYIVQGRIHVDAVAGLHEAAARVAGAHERNRADRASDIPRYRAILVDPDFLSRREMGLLCVFQRHVTLPIWSLPSASKHKEMRTQQGVLPWEDAIQAMAQVLLNSCTQQIPKGSIGNPQSATVAPASADNGASSPLQHAVAAPRPSDNDPSATSAKPAETPVATEVAARYDDHVSPVVLSEQELRALMGSPDQ
jgi:hypothetical protein